MAAESGEAAIIVGIAAAPESGSATFWAGLISGGPSILIGGSMMIEGAYMWYGTIRGKKVYYKQ
jgi:hypothetical protein